MKRLRTWLFRLAGLAAALVAVAAVGWLVVGTRLADWLITTRLEGLGIEVSRLDVESAGLGRSRLIEVDLGPGSWLTADALTATYGISGLLGGRLESLIISAAVWTVQLREGEVSWGWPVPSVSTGEPLDLPLKRLDLDRVTIRIVDDDVVHEMTVSGMVARTGATETSIVLTVAEDLVTSEVNARLTGPTNGLLELGGQVVLMSDAGRVPLAIHGVLNTTAGTGWLDFETPTFEVDEPAGLARLLLGDRAGDLQLGGAVTASGRVVKDSDAFGGRIDLVVTDGLAASDRNQFEINGVDAAVQVELWPTVISAIQPFTFRGGHLGELPLTGGAARVTLDIDQHITVDELAWSMGEYGRFDASSFELDTHASAFDTVIGVHDASLDSWLRLLSGERARGEGSLYGEFEVAIDGDNPDRPFSFGEGLLEAQPATGWIAVGGEQIRNLLQASDPRFRDRSFSDDVGDRIIAALEDFAFTVLRMQFLPDNDSRMLRVELAGRGRQGANAIEVGSLTLNVRGFAEYLYLAVMLGKEFSP